MYVLLVSIVIGLFAAMLFLNIYFRLKVFKVYKTLVQHKVEFGAAHIFNEKKMAAEIFPHYPGQVDNIKIFVRHIRYSIKMATILTTLITLFGAILMYYK